MPTLEEYQTKADMIYSSIMPVIKSVYSEEIDTGVGADVIDDIIGKFIADLEKFPELVEECKSESQNYLDWQELIK